jgi:signal peptidase II
MSWLFFLVAGLVVAADQVSKKALASHFLPDESRTVIPHALWLTYVQNRHGAFGLFGSHPLLLAVVALAVVLVFYYWYRQDGATTLTHVAFGLILGGAIGNIVDRLRFGYVVDFIDLRWWPVFNVADSAISIGVTLLLLRILLHDRRRSPAEIPERTPVEL